MKFSPKIFILLALGFIALPVLADYVPPPSSPPTCPAGIQGCDPPVDVSVKSQLKAGGLAVQGIFRALTNFLVGGAPGEVPSVGTQAAPGGQPLLADIEGAIGAAYYCDKDGNNCTSAPPSSWPGGDGPGDGVGITRLDQGYGIRLSPNPITTTGSISLDVSGGLTNGRCDGADKKLLWNGSTFICGDDISSSSTSGGTVTKISTGAGLTANTNVYAVPGGDITTEGTISIRRDCADGYILKWNRTNTTWDCAPDDSSTGSGSGTVTSINVKSPLDTSIADTINNGAITTNGVISLQECAEGQIYKMTTVGGNLAWRCSSDIDTDTNSGGDITGIAAGRGISVSNGASGVATVSISSSGPVNCNDTGGNNVAQVCEINQAEICFLTRNASYIRLQGTGDVTTSGTIASGTGIPGECRVIYASGTDRYWGSLLSRGWYLGSFAPNRTPGGDGEYVQLCSARCLLE